MSEVAVSLIYRAMANKPLDEFRGNAALKGFAHEPDAEPMPLASTIDAARFAVGLERLVGDDCRKHLTFGGRSRGGGFAAYFAQQFNRRRRQRYGVLAPRLVDRDHHRRAVKVKVAPNLPTRLGPPKAGELQEAIQTDAVQRAPTHERRLVYGRETRCVRDESVDVGVRERVRALSRATARRWDVRPRVRLGESLHDQPAAEPPARRHSVSHGLRRQANPAAHFRQPAHARVRRQRRVADELQPPTHPTRCRFRVRSALPLNGSRVRAPSVDLVYEVARRRSRNFLNASLHAGPRYVRANRYRNV